MPYKFERDYPVSGKPELRITHENLTKTNSPAIHVSLFSRNGERFFVDNRPDTSIDEQALSRHPVGSCRRVTQGRELNSVSYHDELFTGKLPNLEISRFDIQNFCCW